MPVYSTLQAMINPNEFQSLGVDWNWDGETITKATGFVHQLESSSFLVCFKILLEVLSQLRGLTLKLQMQAADIIYAYEEVGSIIVVGKDERRIRAGFQNYYFQKHLS